MISLVELVAISGVATLSAAGASHGLNLLRQAREGRSGVPVRSGQHDEESGRPSAGTWHEPRYGKRHPVSCRIEYAAGSERWEGTLVDMSRQGWRARGMQPVIKGTTLVVHVYIPDLAQPITIDQAVVRWTDGLEFGVEVTGISQESASKLSDYLSTHYPVPDTTPAHALSPFSYN